MLNVHTGKVSMKSFKLRGLFAKVKGQTTQHNKNTQDNNLI